MLPVLLGAAVLIGLFLLVFLLIRRRRHDTPVAAGG